MRLTVVHPQLHVQDTKTRKQPHGHSECSHGEKTRMDGNISVLSIVVYLSSSSLWATVLATLAAASRIPFFYALIKGTIIHDFQKLHEKYGPIIQIAPNDVSFAHLEVNTDIFQPCSEQGQLLKDPLWWARRPGHPDSFLGYVNVLVAQLQDLVSKSTSAHINITTFDVSGDLGFGECFDCLQHSKYHPWVALLFGSVKAAGFVITTRYYPLIEAVLVKSVPRPMRKIQRYQYQKIVDKVQLPDFNSYAIDEGGSLRLDAVNHSPERLQRLQNEVRSAFSILKAITLDAVRNLPFLKAVIQEGLRLCPLIPWMLPRLFPQGGRPICDTWLPGGSTSFCFLNDYRQIVQPFALSPRACLAQRLAWAKLWLILSKLVWMFDIGTIDGQGVDWEDLQTHFHVERNPIKVRISPRIVG
ncbi:cytochrome P450 [Aspergillus spinulosporus]